MSTKEQEILAATDPGDEEARLRARFQQEAPGKLEAFARGAAQGATFEFGDEISAGIRSLRALAPGGETPGEAFESEVGEVRARNTAAREAHPVISGLGTVAGAAATTLAGGAVVRGATGAAKVTAGTLARVGAVEGAVTGAGAAEGGVVERAIPAAVGAGVGAVAAPAVSGLLRGAGRVGTQALDVTGLRPSELSEGVAGRVAGRLVDTVEERAESRLAASLPEGQNLARAAEGLASPRSSIETRRVTGTSRPLTIMDIDENVAGVARAARGVQGAAKTELPEFLAERVGGQEQRVLDDALRLTGAGERASIFETTEEIITRRSELATPLYEAAYQRSVPREVLGDVFDDKAFQKAYERGVRIAKREGIDITPIGDLLPEGGGMIGPQEIPIQAIDFMKRGLDDLIEVGFRSSKGMGRQEARGIRNQLNDLLQRVDEVVPEYAEARSVFAGESKMKEAFEQGQRLFQLEPAEAQSIIDALPESEREMFVRGGFEKLAERVESASASFDVTKRAPLANRTRDRQRLRVLFPSDEAFAEFQTGLADEASIAQTNRFVTGGSNTAEKLAEMAELSGVDVAGLMTGNVAGLAARAGAGMLRRRTRGFSSDIGEAMLPSLTATGEEAERTLTRLTTLRQGVGRDLTRRQLVEAGVVGVGAGGAAGRSRTDKRRVDEDRASNR